MKHDCRLVVDYQILYYTYQRHVKYYLEWKLQLKQDSMVCNKPKYTSDELLI